MEPVKVLIWDWDNMEVELGADKAQRLLNERLKEGWALVIYVEGGVAHVRHASSFVEVHYEK